MTPLLMSACLEAFSTLCRSCRTTSSPSLVSCMHACAYRQQGHQQLTLMLVCVIATNIIESALSNAQLGGFCRARKAQA